MRSKPMKLTTLSKLAAVLIVAGMSAGCANTIRGAGQDAANAVDATQSAGRNVERAAN